VPILFLTLPLVALLQEGAHAEEGFTPFSINTGMAFWTLLVFCLLLALLWRLGWPALLKSIEDREHRIQKQLDEAEKARAEAAALLEQQKALLGAAKLESQDLLAKARTAGEKEREASLARARQEAEALLERARQEIQAEKDKAVQALRREAVDLSIAAASKLIQARLDSEANRKLVTEYLDTLGRSQ
jgi:F-type H+-transporting ATPase subunit b